MQKPNPVLYPVHKCEGIIEAASPGNLSSGFPTRSDTNRDVQQRKMTRYWNFRIEEVEVLYCLCSDKKGVVTTHLICVFLFAYAKIRFSHAADQLNNIYDVYDMAMYISSSKVASLHLIKLLPQFDNMTCLTMLQNP